VIYLIEDYEYVSEEAAQLFMGIPKKSNLII
jgi:hypothetical protein